MTLEKGWFISKSDSKPTLNKATTASFRILSNSLLINQPIIRRYIVWATDSIVK
jgi:hypothetical protein